MSSPSHDLAARTLLDNAVKASIAVRGERRGFWHLVVTWLELREWRKQTLRREQQAAAQALRREQQAMTQAQRCRNNEHEIADWKPIALGRQVYAPGPRNQDTLPVRILDVYRGHCRHCGHPHTRTLDA